MITYGESIEEEEIYIINDELDSDMMTESDFWIWYNDRNQKITTSLFDSFNRIDQYIFSYQNKSDYYSSYDYQTGDLVEIPQLSQREINIWVSSGGSLDEDGLIKLESDLADFDFDGEFDSQFF